MFDVAAAVVVLHVPMTTTVRIFIGCHFLCPTFSHSHFGIIKSNSLHKYDATQLTGSVLPMYTISGAHNEVLSVIDGL